MVKRRRDATARCQSKSRHRLGIAERTATVQVSSFAMLHSTRNATSSPLVHSVLGVVTTIRSSPTLTGHGRDALVPQESGSFQRSVSATVSRAFAYGVVLGNAPAVRRESAKSPRGPCRTVRDDEN